MNFANICPTVKLLSPATIDKQLRKEAKYMAYDVFISYKNSTPDGGHTPDRKVAAHLHRALRKEGLEVFFSERDLTTTEFMNEIFQAIDDARVLILVGSSADYINSPWVRNEWSTFLHATQSGRKPDGRLVTVLLDMTADDLPVELRNSDSFSARDTEDIINYVFSALDRDRNPKKAGKKRALILAALSVVAVAAALAIGYYTYFKPTSDLVRVNGIPVSQSVTEIVADNEKVTNLQALENYDYLDSISFNNVLLSSEDLDHIQNAIPNGDISVKFDLFGRKLDCFSTVIDLRLNKDVDLDKLADGLVYAPRAEVIKLDGCGFSDDTLLEYQTLHPEYAIDWNITFSGAKFSSLTESIDLSNRDDISLDALKNELDSKQKYFTRFNDVDLSNCGFSPETLREWEQEHNINLTWEFRIADQTYKTNVTYLDLGFAGIRSISELKYCDDLVELKLGNTYGNEVSDISPLAGLTKLERLDLSTNLISDISPLSNLTNLQELSLWGNPISDLSPIAGLKNLRELDLAFNYELTDISPISSLTGLTSINFCDNSIQDFSPLANLTNLTYLGLDRSNVTDISFVRNLVNLEGLRLNANTISDLTPLKNLKSLELLEISGSKIADISPLANLTNLTTLSFDTELVEDFSPMHGMKKLQSFFITTYDPTNPQLDALKKALPECDITVTEVNW